MSSEDTTTAAPASPSRFLQAVGGEVTTADWPGRAVLVRGRGRACSATHRALQRKHREGKLLSNRDALDALRLLGVERIECLQVYGRVRTAHRRSRLSALLARHCAALLVAL